MTNPATIGSGIAAGTPAVVLTSGAMNLFVVNTSGQLVTYRQTAPGNNFSGFADIGGDLQ